MKLKEAPQPQQRLVQPPEEEEEEEEALAPAPLHLPAFSVSSFALAWAASILRPMHLEQSCCPSHRLRLSARMPHAPHFSPALEEDDDDDEEAQKPCGS